MKKLENLKALHRDMVFKKERVATFTVDINKHPFSCIFLLEDDSRSLFLTTLGLEPHTIEVEINSYFDVPNQLKREDYDALLVYLNLKYNPLAPFKPLSFFSQIDMLSPNRFIQKPATRELMAVICKKRQIDEAEKIFFCGWRHNAKDESVRQCNFEKTILIVGKRTASYLRRANISSCWSDDSSKENLAEINKYISQK